MSTFRIVRVGEDLWQIEERYFFFFWVKTGHPVKGKKPCERLKKAFEQADERIKNYGV